MGGIVRIYGVFACRSFDFAGKNAALGDLRGFFQRQFGKSRRPVCVVGRESDGIGRKPLKLSVRVEGVPGGRFIAGGIG